MSIQEVAPEQLAELFHHYHQALAPDFDCASKPSETWDHVPDREKNRLIAAGTDGDRPGARRIAAVFCEAWRGRVGLLNHMSGLVCESVS